MTQAHVGEAEGVAIEIDWSSEPPPAYANGAQIVHSGREFALVFTDFVAFAGRGGAGPDAARARVVASLRMTPDVFLQVAAACAANWNKFADHVADPASHPPRFALVGADGVGLEGAPPAKS
ncbi:MAG: hypothetical protein IT373_22975 [Polyangiaceae bacterium]|nr:hypothetical protein [Polyangiaceae bacterium]